MSQARDRMVRNSGFILLQRAALLVVGLLYALIVPRVLGPGDFGRLSLLISLSTLFFIAGDLGLPQALSRQLPELLPGSTRDLRRAWLGVLVRVRVGVSLLAGVAFAGWTAWLFPDLPRPAIGALALAIVAGGVVDPLVTWLLGRNEADRWGWSFLLRRAQYLVLLPLGYRWGGLNGAALGVVAAEALVLAYALRQHPEGCNLRAPVATVPRAFWTLALSFLAGNVLAGAYRYSGETLVRWSGCDYHEVGFFGAALNVFAAAEAGAVQLLASTAPFLSGEMAAGRRAETARWLERLLVVLLAVGGAGVVAAFAWAEALVPRIFGAAFQPVAAVLPLTATALVAAVLAHVAVNAALAARRPRVYIGSAALRLALFWAVGLPAARLWGAWGAWLGALLAHAVAAAWATAAARREVPYGARFVLVPLVMLLPGCLLAAGGWGGAGLLVYAGGLLASRLVRREEWQALRHGWRTRRENAT